MKIFKSIALLLCFTAFFSCYDQKVTLNADKKSGVLSLEYTFDDDDFEVISLALSAAPVGGENGAFDPSILIDQNEFTNYINGFGIKEITLKKASITKKSNGKGLSQYTGNIIIEFSDFEKLISKFPTAENGFVLKKENDKTIISQLVDMSTMGDIETLDNFIELTRSDKPNWYTKFINSQFNIELNLKTPIVESRGLQLSSDKKRASYNFKASDMLGEKRKNLDFMMKF